MTKDSQNKITLWSKLTLGLCLLAIAAEVVLTFTATNNPWSLGIGDAGILFYLVGPYLLLALIAWSNRRHLITAAIVFIVSLLLAGWGLYDAGLHAYRFRTEEEYRLVQPVGVFLVPLGQWVATGLLLAGIGYRRIIRRTSRDN